MGYTGFPVTGIQPIANAVQLHHSRFDFLLGRLPCLLNQIGSFLGVWLGGRIYDMVNSYDTVWVIAILLGVAAAILHLPITDWPVRIDSTIEASEVKS